MDTPFHLYIVNGCFHTTMQNWEVVTESIYGQEILTHLLSGPLQNKCADPCSTPVESKSGTEGLVYI